MPDYASLNCIDGVIRYAMFGDELGGFLTAVLYDRLIESAGRADESNLRRLGDYASFLYNYMPSGSYGSREAVAAWQEARRKQPASPHSFRFPDCVHGLVNAIWDQRQTSESAT